MVVDLKKFQAIIINGQNKSNRNSIVKINNIKIKPKKCVTILGVEIDDKLHFEKHESSTSKKASS